MASSVVLKLTSYLVVVCLMANAFMATKAEVTCGMVMNDLYPCISYVSAGGAVPENCCNGVRTLNNVAQSTADRQNVCKCLKQAVNGISYTGYNLGLAAGLPSKCGVNIPYKISPSTDCDSEDDEVSAISVCILCKNKRAASLEEALSLMDVLLEVISGLLVIVAVICWIYIYVVP